MNNRPDGNELLAVARRTLLEQLMPLLPPAQRYEALMIAKAMAIAGRELEQQGQDTSGEQIRQFYLLAGQGAAVPATESGLADLIRKKAVDQAHHGALHQLLLSLTQAKLAITNPKYLEK